MFGGKYKVNKPVKHVAWTPVVTTPHIRTTTKHPSLVTDGGNCSKKPTINYTGDNMLGIGTMHKSNSVPVFSKEEAKDIATMRRN